ncbi:hypothetical protein IT396_03655 [Candidatus Nomurabacteria bacterium]|nr:hypothetical protein [Candidatus Nomurabacteria bacterium]
MKRLILTIALLFVFLPLSLQAQTTPTTQTEFCTGTRCSYIPLEPLPGQQIGSQGVDFGSYLNYAFTLFIVIGGMFAVATFVWGGIMYMVSDVAKSKDLGRKQMQRAVYGLVVLLGSYVLLYTINPQLISLDRFDTALEQLSRGTSTSAPVSGVSVQNSQPAGDEIRACQSGQPPGRINYVPGGWQCVPR